MSARSSRRREAAHHPTPRLDAWTKRLTHGLVITAIAIGLLYLSGAEDRSLERAVERSAREHDSHVQQDSGGGTNSRASTGGTPGLRGQPDVVGAAALSDAVDTDTVDDAGADDDIDNGGDGDLPDVDPEGQLQEEFKQEVTQAGMDELKASSRREMPIPAKVWMRTRTRRRRRRNLAPILQRPRLVIMADQTRPMTRTTLPVMPRAARRSQRFQRMLLLRLTLGRTKPVKKVKLVTN